MVRDVGIAALARVVAALAALAALVVEIEASPNARARTPGRLHHAHLRHESVVFILEFGELGAFGRVARRRGDGVAARSRRHRMRRFRRRRRTRTPPRARARRRVTRPRFGTREGAVVVDAFGGRVQRRFGARVSRRYGVRAAAAAAAIRRGHGVCTFATTPGESYAGASVDRPSVVETSARTAAACAAAASAMDRWTGLVVRTRSRSRSLFSSRAALGTRSLSSSGGKRAEVHLGLVSVVVGASVASVDGVVASVAMARGRAETLVGGARVVAQGGMAARAR